jgi:tetratricopeptide (TPR) repeat protein
MKLLLRSGVKWNEKIILLLLILVISSSFNCLNSQNTPVKPTRQSSFEAFSKGNFEQAYTEFSELLKTYSKDPLYKYYSGVCLVKLNRNPAEALHFLEQALQGAVVVRTLPSDALFYLGRAQQMSGKFIEALGSYNLYTEQIGRKTAREQEVPEFILQCNEKKGALSEAEINPVALSKNNKPDNIKQNVDSPLEDTVQQSVNKGISEKIYLTPGYEKLLDDAIKFQFKADSLNSLSAGLKKELVKLPDNQKTALKGKISEIEILATAFQKSADKKYSEANAAMNPQKEKSVPKDSIRKTDNVNSNVPAAKTDSVVNKDSVQKSDFKVIKKTVSQTDTIKRIVPAIKVSSGLYSIFEVLDKPVTDKKEKIQIDPDVPSGLVYRIQIAVFRNPVAPVYFKGITPVYGFKVSGTDKTSYYAGMFRRSADAKKALAAVKTKGFRDAFIASFSGKKSVSADRASILEKEWGKKPFANQLLKESETSIDTVTPALSFRVEVMKSLKPLKDDIVDGIKKMSGSRGMDAQQRDDGNFAYLIGKFITFESAADYAGLLIRNGYPKARVVAFLGNKEIPVETAKHLFENLE